MGDRGPRPGTDEAVDEVLVTAGGRTRLHLPGDDGTRCATKGRFRRKRLAVYPPAHRRWCRDCRRLWAAAR